jgi:hypothetical protein
MSDEKTVWGQRMNKIDTGTASIDINKAVVAGSFQSITYTYTAGHPIDDTGFIKIVFRHVGDFGRPQFDDPKADNYCTIRTTGDCTPELRWDPKGHTRPWGQALFIKITRGFLNRGEKIIVIFGDKTGGSSGWQMQTFCEHSFEFKTLVDPIATYEFKELPSSPELAIVAGAPDHAHCIAPSLVQVNEDFHCYLKLEDRWGNPVSKPIKSKSYRFADAGIQRITMTDEKTGLKVRSNPIQIVTCYSTIHPYWADFHGQSEETVGSNSIDDYFAFARDYALLDIAGHQGNDFQITDEFWDKINTTTRDFYTPGKFVTFPGYEWSGNTPLGGDRNVYFLKEGAKISRSCTDLLPGKQSVYPNSFTATDLFNNLEKQQIPSFVFAHVGGRYADIAMHNPDIELAMEVHSDWGTFEWLVEDALSRGYHVAICANSDGHKGRPGASYPGSSKFGSLGGYTCVLATALDRESIYQALKARHCYATTGNRSLLDVRLVTDDGRELVMGDLVTIEDKTEAWLDVKLAGTCPIESVVVRNGNEPVHTIHPYDKNDLGDRIKIIWSGAELRGRARMVCWDGSLQINNNAIIESTAINFWNSNSPLIQHDDTNLEWHSITTGGLAGLMIRLKQENSGELLLQTRQRDLTVQIDSLGVEPHSWDCGGLKKRIDIYRLPSKQDHMEFNFKMSLTSLHEGLNPIYIQMIQEDGHMAWSSPIYIMK